MRIDVKLRSCIKHFNYNISTFSIDKIKQSFKFTDLFS
jgi:hypothetical protein